MAKNGPKATTAARIKRTEAYAEKVRTLFAQTVNDILALNKAAPELTEGVMFSFDGTSATKQKKVEALLRRLGSVASLAIEQGIKVEWETANKECDKIVESAVGKKVLSNPAFSAWTSRNTAARDAFIKRAEGGLNLSERIWKSVAQLKEEMEVAITVAAGEGESASAISRKVREYLNAPDLMFRRFRYKIGENEDGSPKYGLKWKKRIKTADGKYKFIDYDKSTYQDQWTGRGYYKSSAQNAMRVARTETNIAYRRADHARWQQLDFVLGQRVQLSKSHPKDDICDTLQGDYPKDFIFDGWHPQCFCFATPILMNEDEMAKMTEAFLKGESYEPKGQQITDYPENFKSWVRNNSDRIAQSRKSGTEPYFIRNNAKVVEKIMRKVAYAHDISNKRKEALTSGYFITAKEHIILNNLLTSELKQSKKSLTRLLNHCLSEEEISAARFIWSNPNKLSLRRVSPLGEGKSIVKEKDKKNIENKAKRGIVEYIEYEFEFNRLKWLLKTEHHKAGFEQFYHLRKK